MQSHKIISPHERMIFFYHFNLTVYVAVIAIDKR